MPQQNVIESVKVTKVFRDFWMREKVTAVNELDIAVRPKEVFGLLGPNGSGKSTTLKMVLGLLFPSSGRISVFGKLPTDVQVKNRIGFLPEESHLYPFLNARETLDYYGRLFHQPRAERRRRVDMLLEMVGLTSVAYRRINEYSKGMQRRIGLAQALINDPDLLILDEPTAGMDPIGTRQFKDLILTLAGRGKTIVLSSHLLADVEDVCDRVCILYGGRRRALGNVDELLARSQTTQLTVGNLDEVTLNRLRDLLTEGGADLLEASVPRDRLEDLFLRIVEEAQQQKLATGGAVAGGQVAEFLRSDQDDGDGLIEELVHGRPEKVEPVDAPTPDDESAAEAAQANGLLEALTAPTETDKPAEPQPSAQAGQAKPPSQRGQDHADRGFIEGLLDDDNQDREQ